MTHNNVGILNTVGVTHVQHICFIMLRLSLVKSEMNKDNVKILLHSKCVDNVKIREYNRTKSNTTFIHKTQFMI